ncbi:hypothetical protein [Salinisphaera sp.]|uniref:hypothetical protein n=1 Tax=Salinisphaera sp. TaxID=1914330 RepID=UPI002D79FBE8|nr:hypothetical protein [Salinisphaera sp.]HET7314928.1 hypothetical protein [Salinisphaera sp.]
MTRRSRPRTLPSRQRGIGAVEYILGTGVLLVILLAPFPFHGTTLNVVQRVILAIQRQHAAYLYLAGMPSLPRGPGGLSQLPGSPVGDGGASGGSGDVFGGEPGASGGDVFGGEPGGEAAEPGGGTGGFNPIPDARTTA